MLNRKKNNNKNYLSFIQTNLLNTCNKAHNFHRWIIKYKASKKDTISKKSLKNKAIDCSRKAMNIEINE